MTDDDREQLPEAVIELVRRRSAARAGRRFAEADALRGEIEAAGWKPVDRGTHSILERAAPPDVVVDGETRVGSPASVPSRLDEPPSALATIVVLAEEGDAPGLDRLLRALATTAPSGSQVVVVLDLPADAAMSPSGWPPIEGWPPEVVRTSTRLGRANALAIGLRRACGAVIVLADPSVEPTGDAVSPLVEALEDPSVAVAGEMGLWGVDLRHLVASERADAVAVEGSWLAFRRVDGASLEAIDPRFEEAAYLDAWLSAVLRLADGAGVGPPGRPRRAQRVSLPLRRHAEPPTLAAQRERGARRQAYRWLDLARLHPELLVTTEDASA